MANNKVRGSFGEDVAARYLQNKGYRVLARNLHSRYGEIDIIAQYRNLIVFVEVKLRKKNSFGFPAESVTLSKQSKIKKTAFVYISERMLTDFDFRFDIIEITGDNEVSVNHIENAFY